MDKNNNGAADLTDIGLVNEAGIWDNVETGRLERGPEQSRRTFALHSPDNSHEWESYEAVNVIWAGIEAKYRAGQWSFWLDNVWACD